MQMKINPQLKTIVESKELRGLMREGNSRRERGGYLQNSWWECYKSGTEYMRL